MDDQFEGFYASRFTRFFDGKAQYFLGKESAMFEIIEDDSPQEAVIKVMGVGGCGGNAVEHMIGKGVQGVEFICANTDAQALKRSNARVQLQLGANLTR